MPAYTFFTLDYDLAALEAPACQKKKIERWILVMNISLEKR